MCGASSSLSLASAAAAGSHPADRPTVWKITNRSNAPHVPRQHARLTDRKGHVTGGAGETGRMVRAEKVIVDRLGHTHADKSVPLLPAIAFDAVDRIHRIVAADQEEVANIVATEHGEDGRKIGLREFVATASQG